MKGNERHIGFGFDIGNTKREVGGLLADMMGHELQIRASGGLLFGADLGF